MTTAPKLTYDVATALAQGQRDSQEDAVIADFPLDGEVGFAVLADGMGGHAAGDIASKIVVTEVFSELKLQSGETQAFENDMPGILAQAAAAANDCVRLHAEHHPGSRGMGATLVAPVLVGNKLYWVSVGDSPLYLYREGELLQLNEDHSLAGQIDLLVQKGLMDPHTAENHPDRHCLTSVLSGDQIAKIDCPRRPLTLKAGDIIVVASDGLQFLENSEIEGLIQETEDQRSTDIARSLISALDALGDPHQDNVSLCVIKAGDDCPQQAPIHITEDPEQTISALFAHSEELAGAGSSDPVADHPAPGQIAASAATSSGNKITIIARKTLDGLSMLYHFKRPSEKSA